MKLPALFATAPRRWARAINAWQSDEYDSPRPRSPQFLLSRQSPPRLWRTPVRKSGKRNAHRVCHDRQIFRLLFYTPRIAPNTGNAIRTAAATGAELHLVEPLGFDLSEPK